MSDAVIEEQGVEVKKTICWPSPGCHCNCGLLVKVKDNKILGIKGNPEFPYNRGSVCGERVPHFRQWLDHPDQLMYPLKRLGERGEGKWERISWEQALDEIAERLQAIKAQHGAESLSFIEGTYRSDFYAIRASRTYFAIRQRRSAPPAPAIRTFGASLAGAILCTLALPSLLNCLVLLGRIIPKLNCGGAPCKVCDPA
jgi:anaerobic selenocysteine-containing dehydrogenase